jgi:hypothetical protein
MMKNAKSDRKSRSVTGRKSQAPDLLRMSAQEGCPGLPMWSSRAHLSHILLDRAFTDVDTQLEQFATDPLSSPQSVILGHVLCMIP